MKKIQQRKLGWKPDKPDQRDLKYGVHAEMMLPKTLPNHVDLSPLCSPVENQGHLGSCVAHATCGALEYLELWELRDKTGGPEVFGNFESLSRLYVYWNARSLDGDTNEDGGTQLRSAILAIRSQGICREKIWPYDESQVFVKPPESAYQEGQGHKVLWGYRINSCSLYEMKQCLAWGYPFIFGIIVYPSFMTDDVAQTGIIPMPGNEIPEGGHALCAVGYDDAKQSFLVRNSWGSDWGIHGYCWIPYTYLTSQYLASDFWTLRKNSAQS